MPGIRGNELCPNVRLLADTSRQSPSLLHMRQMAFWDIDTAVRQATPVAITPAFSHPCNPHRISVSSLFGDYMNRNGGSKDKRGSIEIERRAMWKNNSRSVAIEIYPIQTTFFETLIETITFSIITDNDPVYR
jgi:hypothetical protein